MAEAHYQPGCPMLLPVPNPGLVRLRRRSLVLDYPEEHPSSARCPDRAQPIPLPVERIGLHYQTDSARRLVLPVLVARPETLLAVHRRNLVVLLQSLELPGNFAEGERILPMVRPEIAVDWDWQNCHQVVVRIQVERPARNQCLAAVT